MKRSLFRRHFLLTAGMVLLAFLLLAAAFISLSYRYLIQEKKETLAENTAYVTELLQNIVEMGYSPAYEEGFPLYSPILSSISECDILVCDVDGTVLLYAANSSNSEGGGENDASTSTAEVTEAHVGSVISSTVLEALLTDGSYSGMTDLGIYEGTRYFVAGATVSVPSTAGSGVAYLVLMTTSAANLVSMWRTLATLFFFTAVVVLCIAFISSSIFSRQQVRPLQEMSDAVRRFGLGEYDVRVIGYDRQDEIGELAVAFNTMADSLASSEQRRQEFMANISHELKTPMTTISGFTNGILDGTIPPEKVNDSLQIISSETARLSRLVRKMLDVSALQARASSMTQVAFDISETMVQVMISREGKIRARRLDMDIHIPDDPVMVWGDPDSITQVCYNLLDNAAKFATSGTAITLTIYTKGPKAHISVKNKGETIPPEELGMIFDRFHKSDRSRSIDKEGVGLGLYIVKTILNNHKENITVTSQDGVTEFTFTLTMAA